MKNLHSIKNGLFVAFAMSMSMLSFGQSNHVNGGKPKQAATNKAAVSCGTRPTYNSCPGFRTQTQGGWGANPNGNNPGAYLNANFAGAFPSGLTIGCTNKLVLTSAAAVNAFLPSGSTARALSNGTRTNPGSSYSNVLAGQLVAATINVQFDLTYPNFSSSSTNLKDLIIASGTFSGWSVGKLLVEANKKIGGCASAFPASLSQYNAALSSVNENYTDGVTRGSFLTCPTPITASGIVGDVSCYGGSNGSIALTVSGGVAPYTYLWSNGATTKDVSGLSEGNYSVVITDNNGLTRNLSFYVSQPSALVATISSTVDVSCFGGSNGSIDLSVSGGTPDYSYLWSNGETTQDISGLSAGEYTVTITDSKGCSTPAAASIGQAAELTVSASVTLAIACGCNGTATAVAGGGTAPYTYDWSTGASGESATIGDICPGTSVSLTVTDDNGCTASAEAGTVTNKLGCTGYSVEEQVQGKRNNGTPVDGDRSDPNAVLGTPEFSNTPGGFYSLGFGGYIVIKLDGAIEDRPGNDLRISETTYNSPNPQNCNNYPERARISVSNDLLSFTDVGEICQDGEVDIYPLSCVMYVKITDITDPRGFGGQIVDGFDVDGIQCINTPSNARMEAPVAADKNNTNVAVKQSRASLDVYPNPADNFLSITLEATVAADVLNVSLVDLMGREIRTVSVTPETTRHMMEIGLDGLNSGVYMIRVTGKNFNQTKKFLKK
jgi:hypothetical protein